MTPDVKASDSFAVGDIIRLRPDTPGRAHIRARWSPSIAWNNYCEHHKGEPVEVIQIDDRDYTLKVRRFNASNAGSFWICPSWGIKTTRKQVEIEAQQIEAQQQIRSSRGDLDAILAMQLRGLGLSPGQIPFKDWKVGDVVKTSRLNRSLRESAREKLFKITQIDFDTDLIMGEMINEPHLHGDIGPRKYLLWVKRP